MIALESVLVRPVVTEKTVAMKDKFTFIIHSSATKNDVRNALKEFYGISPITVHISVLPEKSRVMGRGRSLKKRAETKKAIITLLPGTSLDFNAFK
ncbi:50S ribosomal protein L23 [Candidatus Gracilibacteria bacterium]|nr:50S ribosomal protein L23 [Candidatus Gracilibacteria bacterium]